MEDMLESYPELPVVLAHAGYPDLDWGFSLAERFPQVWLDLTNVPDNRRETLEPVQRLQGAVELCRHPRTPAGDD